MQSTTTKVEVLEQAGKSEGGFDPRGIYERESPGVVPSSPPGSRRPAATGTAAGLGSGFVISGDGEIATNAHVVTSGEGAAIRKASSVFVRFADGNQVPAQVKGFDPFADVALLKIDPEGLTLRPLPLGSTKDLHVGAPVAAIGSPFGEEQSLSVGVISALDRSIQSLTGFDTIGAIQTDAAINHGNSGGPLLDGRGRVLGINAQIQTSTGDGSGVGFAVPADAVRRSLAQLRRDGRARYAYLGVASVAVYPQLARPLRPVGALGRVDPGRHRRRARPARPPQGGRRHAALPGARLPHGRRRRHRGPGPPGARRERPGQGAAGLRAGRHGDARRPARRASAGRCA